MESIRELPKDTSIAVHFLFANKDDPQNKHGKLSIEIEGTGGMPLEDRNESELLLLLLTHANHTPDVCPKCSKGHADNCKVLQHATPAFIAFIIKHVLSDVPYEIKAAAKADREAEENVVSEDDTIH